VEVEMRHRDICVYGTIIITIHGVVAQSLGLRADGYCIVMPKYVQCRDPYTPWIAPWGTRLCRVIRGYGPHGIARAVAASGVRQVYSGTHGALVPVIAEWDVALSLSPQAALARAIASGDPDVVATLGLLRRLGAPVSAMGLTGSRAAGYNHAVSDIDLVVFGEEAAEEMYRVFSSLSGKWDPAGKDDLGGVKVEPVADLSWRRRVVKTIYGPIGVTWIGAPERENAHCPPLSRGVTDPDPPGPLIAGEVVVHPGQPSALLYPPCARAKDGTWIVSYEYNVAGVLYRGGRMLVEGAASASGSIIYLGTREAPGRIVYGPRLVGWG